MHGRGRVVPVGQPEFGDLIAEFRPNDDVRSIARGIVVVEIDRIANSRGFVVPRIMDHVGDRHQLFQWAETQQAKRGDGWERDYVRDRNAASIDGLKGMDPPEPMPGTIANAKTRR